MIAYKTYNIIFPIFKIEDNVMGGAAEIRKVFADRDLQEDDYLIGLTVENATEVRDCFEILLNLGLTYDDAAGLSEDFTVVAKEGIWWPVPWLVNNDVGCWFIADVEAPI